MTDDVKAQCYATRHPGKNQEPMEYGDIALVVRKTDKTHPTAEGVRVAVNSFMKVTPAL